jgi:hypothetical protein
MSWVVVSRRPRPPATSKEKGEVGDSRVGREVGRGRVLQNMEIDKEHLLSSRAPVGGEPLPGTDNPQAAVRRHCG